VLTVAEMREAEKAAKAAADAAKSN